ncbi:hypothetical protein [Candidatus Sarmatiella mevalonica]|nr:hypothetical protein [Candidatus Sarmatiella mevalonica]
MKLSEDSRIDAPPQLPSEVEFEKEVYFYFRLLSQIVIPSLLLVY